MQKTASSRTTAMVNTLKATGQDFEWYPTTPEIIACVKNDMRQLFSTPGESKVTASVLDCGAGDGRVLDALTLGSKYAIEKAVPLLNNLDKSIFVVGTDFNQNTLIDKRVAAVYSNPPYGEFEQWSTKIIREANAAVAYLVVPERWESSKAITAAIEAREAYTKVIGQYDFAEADREARAKIHVVRVQLAGYRLDDTYWGSRRERAPKVDPFNLWFDSHFSVNASQGKRTEFEEREAIRASVRESVATSGELITHKGLVSVLEELYHRDMNHLMDNYFSVCGLDANLLDELGVSVRGIKEALRLKITSLKDVYWNELFQNLTTITDRLTSKSRKRLLEKLTSNTHIDFTAENAHAVVMWAVKNANTYFEEQLVDAFEKMTEKANVQLYRSNKRTFGDENWRYLRHSGALDRYKLEYRVVLARVGGICTASLMHRQTDSGLSEEAERFVDDLSTIAYTIGFDTFGLRGSRDHEWDSNKRVCFFYRCSKTGEMEKLFEVKAFKNGNLHIKFAQDFIMKLNVEAGRLLGWIKSAADAAREMDIPEDAAASCFGATLKITRQDVPCLEAA